MFGQDNTQMGSVSAQNPAALDNVPQQEYTTQSANPDPAVAQVMLPTQPMFSAPGAQPVAPTPMEHQLTSDNPFIQDPISMSAQQQQQPAPTFQAMPPQQQPYDPSAHTPSGPVQPQAAPVTDQPVEQNNADYLDAIASDTAAGQPTESDEVDHDKLADMKQQALAHLEPLAEHLDGTPEETFKTTMMMIQASDNHRLLEKALEAAKKITDDKARAQALLDIINEINYFTQNQL